MFDVRVDGVVTRVQAAQPHDGRLTIRATLTRRKMILAVGDRTVAIASPGLLDRQPKDGLSIGRDDLSAAGDYVAPQSLQR